MGALQELKVPGNRSEMNPLRQMLARIRYGQELKIYVGSCPDYSHDGQKYTHETLCDGVPLLTQYHLEIDVRLLDLLARHGVECKMVVMIADVEATDEFFCNRFTGGDQKEFLSRCRSSIEITRDVLPRPNIQSSSFFEEFGYEEFMETQMQYQDILENKYRTDTRFSYRADSDTRGRMALYRKMYPFVFGPAVQYGEREEFLTGRTIRTMAQYLALGRLIAAKSPNAVVISHLTTNISLFNDRGKHLLPGDDPRYPQPTIPIFTMTRKVY